MASIVFGTREQIRFVPLCGVLCFAALAVGITVHDVFLIGTTAQLVYYLAGVVAVLLCALMAMAKSSWGKLLAAEAFVFIAFLPRLIAPIITGVLDMTWVQALHLLFWPGLFSAAFLAAYPMLKRREGHHHRIFAVVMGLVAFGMHAFLLPLLLGEPLTARIIHTTELDEEILETNPVGSLVLTHSALVPVTATLYAHRDDELDVLHHVPLEGYPVGIRVRDDHALIALRIQNEDKVVQRIDFVRLAATGLTSAGSYPCTPAQSPSHLVNNMSPDGRLLALADGSFVDMDTCEGVERFSEGANPDGKLVFVEWTEPAGLPVYYHERERRLVVLHPDTRLSDTYSLRGRPLSPFSLSVLPDGQYVWYEEDDLFLWQRVFVEKLADHTRTRLARKRGKVMEGTVTLWAGEHQLAYITALGTLESLTFDTDRARYTGARHTQLFETTGCAAVAPESGWLFWVTPAAHHDDGLAIHRERLRTVR